MPIYSYITQSTCLQEIANRLYDSTMTFWTSAELALYLNESLRTWNALTGYWRGDFIFPSAANVTWYDILSLTNTLRPYTVTDANLYVLMQYHFLEPPLGINPWPATGSLQFTADDFLNAVQRRRDELLSLTGCTQTQSTVPAVAGRIQLSDSVIDVRRMAYIPSALFPTQVTSVMWPEDAWAEMSFNQSYLQSPAGTPFAYLLSTQPPISFDTDAPPAYAGNYELLTVNAGAALSAATPSTLLIPDDWTPVLKWGAMADLLSREWQAKDIPRAQYCEMQYRMGVAAMLSSPALLQMRINNVPMQIDSVRAADQYNTGWEGATPGTPDTCYHSGLNLFALSPIANANTFSMTATVVENAPLPTLPGDFIQVSRDDLDAIIDYAQHLSSFKMGGAEFLQTMPLMQRFLKQAAVYNAKLMEIGEFTAMLKGLSRLEEDLNPCMTPDGATIAGTVGDGKGS